MTLSDHQILLRLKANNQQALNYLFKEHYKPVCQRIYAVVKDRAATEDIAQEVFLKIWNKRHQIEVKSFKSYLQRMAFNEAISYLRKNGRFEQQELKAEHMSSTTVSTEQQYLIGELTSNVTEAINALPPKCRAIFQLSRYEGLSYKEIASQLDISIKTVENQMGKALRVLRQTLKGYLN